MTEPIAAPKQAVVKVAPSRPIKIPHQGDLFQVAKVPMHEPMSH